MEYTLKLNEKEIRKYRHQLYNAIGELGAENGTGKALKELAEKMEELMSSEKELTLNILEIVINSAEKLGYVAITEQWKRKTLADPPEFDGWHFETIKFQEFDDLCKCVGCSGLIEGDTENFFPPRLNGFGERVKSKILYWYDLSKNGVVFSEHNYQYNRNTQLFELCKTE